jgi:hypothetical protein
MYGWGHLEPEYADILCVHRKGGPLPKIPKIRYVWGQLGPNIGLKYIKERKLEKRKNRVSLKIGEI